MACAMVSVAEERHDESRGRGKLCAHIDVFCTLTKRHTKNSEFNVMHSFIYEVLLNT